MIEALIQRLNSTPLEKNILYLSDEDVSPNWTSNHDFLIGIQKIAHHIRTTTHELDRVLLLFPSSIAYIQSILACLMTRRIAVPMYPLAGNRNDDRIYSAIKDCQPSLILSSRAAIESMYLRLARKNGIESLSIENKELLQRIQEVESIFLKNDLDQETQSPNHDDPVIIQYTSGSIGHPKGVVLTLKNLTTNQFMIQKAFEFSPESVMVSWLPLFHDMGLIGGVLQPLFTGCKLVFMQPAYFLQKPLRWWQAVSTYRGTCTGGPNFAFQMSATRVKDEDLKNIDLSSLQVVYNGAEPIRRQTLQAFTQKFSSCGFQPRNFLMCYGLAEATLLVASGRLCSEEEEKCLSNPTIEKSSAEPFMDCGSTEFQEEVIVVDPQTHSILPEGQEGEIWLRGPNISQGYWNKAEINCQDFHARSHSNSQTQRKYFRTGDLGILKNGHLYVSGRMKDLIIIGGKNIYPQDIEWTVEQSNPFIKPGSVAAFSLKTSRGESIGIAAEIDRHTKAEDMPGVVRSIIKSVFEMHEASPDRVYLLSQGQLLKTSSGKIRRSANQHALEIGELEAIHRWEASGSRAIPTQAVLPSPAVAASFNKKIYPKLHRDHLGEVMTHKQAKTHTNHPDESSQLGSIESQIIAQLAKLKDIDFATIHAESHMSELGLDSVGIIELRFFVQEKFGVSPNEEFFYHDPTIKHVCEEIMMRR